MNVYLTALVDSDPEMAQLALTPPRTNGPQNDLSKLPRGPKLQDQVHLLGYPLTITPEIIPREDPRSKTNTIFPEISPRGNPLSRTTVGQSPLNKDPESRTGL